MCYSTCAQSLKATNVSVGRMLIKTGLTCHMVHFNPFFLKLVLWHIGPNISVHFRLGLRLVGIQLWKFAILLFTAATIKIASQMDITDKKPSVEEILTAHCSYFSCVSYLGFIGFLSSYVFQLYLKLIFFVLCNSSVYHCKNKTVFFS